MFAVEVWSNRYGHWQHVACYESRQMAESVAKKHAEESARVVEVAMPRSPESVSAFATARNKRIAKLRDGLIFALQESNGRFWNTLGCYQSRERAEREKVAKFRLSSNKGVLAKGYRIFEVTRLEDVEIYYVIRWNCNGQWRYVNRQYSTIEEAESAIAAFLKKPPLGLVEARVALEESGPPKHRDTRSAPPSSQSRKFLGRKPTSYVHEHGVVLRNALAAFLGDELFHKFGRHDSQSRFWQERIWDRFVAGHPEFTVSLEEAWRICELEVSETDTGREEDVAEFTELDADVANDNELMNDEEISELDMDEVDDLDFDGYDDLDLDIDGEFDLDFDFDF